MCNSIMCAMASRVMASCVRWHQVEGTNLLSLPGAASSSVQTSLQPPHANKVSAPRAGERSQDTPKSVEMSWVGVLPASKAIHRVTVEPVPTVLGLGGGGGLGSQALPVPAQLSVEVVGGIVERLGQASSET